MSDTGFDYLVILTAGQVLSCFIKNRNIVNFRHFWKPRVSISNLGFRCRPYEFLGFGFLRYIFNWVGFHPTLTAVLIAAHVSLDVGIQV